MKLFVAFAFIALALGCDGCHPAPAPVVNPTAVGDAAPVSAPGTCLDVCRNGAALGCAFAADTPAGATCVTFCANYQDVAARPWDLTCRANAKSCAAIDACP